MAAEAEPSNVWLLGPLATLYMVMGDIPAAIRYARRAAHVDPLDPAHWNALERFYRLLGLYDRAEGAIRRRIELQPESRGPWTDMFTLKLVQGRYGEALAAVDSAEARGDPHGSLRRGVVHLWAGELERAGQAFGRGSPEDLEENSGLLQDIAYLRFLRGDTSGTRRMLERVEGSLWSGAGRVDPEDDRWRVLQSAAIRGDTSAAVDALREYMDGGGRDVYRIERSPLFSRVRGDSVFRAELDKLERTVERMRREVQRDLADAGGR